MTEMIDTVTRHVIKFYLDYILFGIYDYDD